MWQLGIFNTTKIPKASFIWWRTLCKLLLGKKITKTKRNELTVTVVVLHPISTLHLLITSIKNCQVRMQTKSNPGVNQGPKFLAGGCERLLRIPGSKLICRRSVVDTRDENWPFRLTQGSKYSKVPKITLKCLPVSSHRTACWGVVLWTWPVFLIESHYIAHHSSHIKVWVCAFFFSSLLASWGQRLLGFCLFGDFFFFNF